MNKIIQILMIDDDEAFANLLMEHMTNAVPEIEFFMECIEDLDSSDQIKKFYDLYLVDNRINGFPKATTMVDIIRQKDQCASIFVVSGHADFKLVKDLCNMRINGFIDKENFDLTPLIAASREANIRERLLKLSKSSDELRNRCKIS